MFAGHRKRLAGRMLEKIGRREQVGLSRRFARRFVGIILALLRR
jgi:hypothetical protein